MEQLLAGLRAAAEPTRLRLLALCAAGELSVSDITQILGQSQPRISRHLKVMGDAGLLDRFREGAWVFYRLAARGEPAVLARRLLELLPEDDAVLRRDAQRLTAIKQARAEAAAEYFRDNAAQWDQIRSLHVDDREVERLLLAAIAPRHPHDLLDIGTGTGRILEVLAPVAERAVGVDMSREMLSLARARLESAGLGHAMVRQGDMYQLPFEDRAFDAACLHQVLHFAEDPAAVVAETARVLRPGGLLAIVDFAPHTVEDLRERQAHRRLGFADAEVAGWLTAADLVPLPPRALPGDPLTVTLWLGEKPTCNGA